MTQSFTGSLLLLVSEGQIYFLNLQTAGLGTLHKGSIIISSHLRSGGWGCLSKSCLFKGLGLGCKHFVIFMDSRRIISSS